MNELKSYIVYTPMDGVAEGIHASDSIPIEGNEVYIKSETDKVIADSEESHKMEIKQLLILNREQANAANRLRDNMERAIQHQKYKRCLAMAKLCAKNVDHLNSEGYIYEKEGHADETNDCIKGTQFYHRWYERWLKIAKQFEEHR